MYRNLSAGIFLLALTNLSWSYTSPYFYNPPYQQPRALSLENSSSSVRSFKQYKQLISAYEARNVEFGFPSESERRRVLANGQYNPDSAIPIDVDVYYRPRSNVPTIFMTIPRFGQGIPYSLGYLTNNRRANGTEIQPYPSYEWHSSHGKNCDGLTSVYRVHIDACNRMWVLDSGEIEFKQYCPPQLVVFDLATAQLVHRYRLPKRDFKSGISRFVTVVTDVEDPPPRGNCKQVHVYMADPTGAGFVVYDVRKNQSWRVENKYTAPDPDFGTHTVAGESFELMDGVVGLAITPPGLGLRRMLYFHALSNDAEVAIPLDVVNNATLWQNADISTAIDQFTLLGKRGVQCVASAITAQGIMLCGHLNPIGIFGWNIRTPYTKQNRQLLAENPETLQFVSGLKIIKNPQGKDEVWVLSNRLQKAFSGTTNYNETNFRIQRCGVDELLQGKGCVA